jgi:hypothetical protein
MKLPEFLRKAGMPMGSVEDFPVGSAERAKVLTVRVMSSWQLVEVSKTTWERHVEQAKKESAPAQLGFKDFDSYLLAVIGRTEQQALRRFEAQPANMGRPQKVSAADTFTQVQRPEPNGVGRQTQVYHDALARERPDLLQQVNAGELTPQTAAPSGLDVLQRAWDKASKAERLAFVDQHADELRVFLDSRPPKEKYPMPIYRLDPLLPTVLVCEFCGCAVALAPACLAATQGLTTRQLALAGLDAAALLAVAEHDVFCTGRWGAGGVVLRPPSR